MQNSFELLMHRSDSFQGTEQTCGVFALISLWGEEQSDKYQQGFKKKKQIERDQIGSVLIVEEV